MLRGGADTLVARRITLEAGGCGSVVVGWTVPDTLIALVGDESIGRGGGVVDGLDGSVGACYSSVAAMTRVGPSAPAE